MWEEVLKGNRNRGFSPLHYKHLKKACEDAYNKYGDVFLNNPHDYKEEIIEQATISYSNETDIENKSGIKIKFRKKFPTKIIRIVNIMRDRTKDVEKLSIFPKKKKKPKPINRKKDKPKPRGPFTDRD
jgi:hypothetical protein